MVYQRKTESEVYASVQPVKTVRDTISPRTIVNLFVLLIVIAIVMTGIGLTTGNASSIGNIEGTHNETVTEPPKKNEESSTTQADTEVEANSSNSSSGVTTTTTSSINFEDPVILGIESSEDTTPLAHEVEVEVEASREA